MSFLKEIEKIRPFNNIVLTDLLMELYKLTPSRLLDEINRNKFNIIYKAVSKSKYKLEKIYEIWDKYEDDEYVILIGLYRNEEEYYLSETFIKILIIDKKDKSNSLSILINIINCRIEYSIKLNIEQKFKYILKLRANGYVEVRDHNNTAIMNFEY